MDTARVIEILLEYKDYLHISNILSFVLRFIGWGIIKGLAYLVDSAQGTLNTIMKNLNFFDSVVVENTITKLRPAALMFLVISLIYIGYQMIMYGKKFDIGKIPNNLIIALLVMFVLPTAMKSMGELTQEAFKLFTTNKTTLATSVISENVTDVYLYDQSNFQKKDIYPRNRIARNRIMDIDPTEEINRDNITNKTVFENKLVPSISEKEESAYQLERINGWFKIDSEYYRWSINFFQIMTTLLITGLVLLFTMVKVVKLIIELAFSKIFIMTGALADITYGQKTKQMLMHIFSIYLTIISVGLTLQLYIQATAWLNNNVSGFAAVMINFGAGLFVLDGPNLLEKIFGVDAGLSSGLRVLMGLNSALDIMGKVGRGLGKAAELGGKALEKGAIIGAGLKGFRDGMIPDLESDMKDFNDSVTPFQELLPNFENAKALGEGNNLDDDLSSDFLGNNPIPPNDLSPSGGRFNNIEDSNIEDDSSIIDDTFGNSNLGDLNGKDISTIEDDINTLTNDNIESLGENNSNNLYSGNVLGLEEKTPSLEKDIPSLEDNIRNGNIPTSDIINRGIGNKDIGNKSIKNKEITGGLNKKIPSLEKEIAKNEGTNIGKGNTNKKIQDNNINNDKIITGIEKDVSSLNKNLGNNLDHKLNRTPDHIKSNNVKGLTSKAGVNKNITLTDPIMGDNFVMHGSRPAPKDIKNPGGSSLVNTNIEVGRSKNKDWQYGNPNYNTEYKENYGYYNGDFIDLGYRRNRAYDKPNYIDPEETRNIKQMLSSALKTKVNNVKNSDLAKKMSTSYKIGNNTAKDLTRYVVIKEEQLKDKILIEKIRRNL